MTLGDRIVVMRDGLVHQCAHPLAVYDHPANRFVASFVGTPPMNFLDGKIVRQNGGLAFHDGATPLPLTAAQARGLERYLDQPVVLGVRPDVFSVEPPPDAKAPARVGVRVSLVEPLGDRKDVYMTTTAHKNLVGRVDGRVSVVEGQELHMFIDMNRVHVFEPGELGMNVTATRDGAQASAN